MHARSLIFDEPRRFELDVSGSVAGRLDRLPEYQNVAIDIDKLYSLDAKLLYSDIRNSLGSVDDETGSRWSVVLQGRAVDGTIVPKLYATYDRGLATPIAHSSVWLRSAGGYSPGDRAQPSANFFFGGFGNNYVDHADEKRYRHQSIGALGLLALKPLQVTSYRDTWHRHVLQQGRAAPNPKIRT